MEAKQLQEIGRRTYIGASVAFIFIGMMHTFAHLTDLSAPQIEADLTNIGTVAGIDAEALDLWHGISLLMGFFSICLGVSNLAALQAASDRVPPIGVCLVNIAMLAAITSIGLLYLGPIQAIGGPVGIVFFAIAAFGSTRERAVTPLLTGAL